MKKIFILPLLLLPLLTGCNDHTVSQLTYGTLIYNAAKEINVKEFETKVNNNENFLMAIYPDESTCGCWDNFSAIIDGVMLDTDLLIYKFPVSRVSSSQMMKDMGGFYEIKNAPTFYIINNQRILKSYRYNSSDPLFSNKQGFIEEINKYCKMPKIILANKEQIDEKIASRRSTILFLRESCADCNYVIPNTLVSYFSHRDTSEVIYGFDIEVYQSDPILYQEIKDQYGLSQTEVNPILGYLTGRVPTFQHYQNSSLIDMAVYFNDGDLSLKSDGFYHLNETYYNSSRNSYFHYLDEKGLKDFTTIEIKEEDTYVINEKRYWKNSSSAYYHDNNLKAFLDYYLE